MDVAVCCNDQKKLVIFEFESQNQGARKKGRIIVPTPKTLVHSDHCQVPIAIQTALRIDVGFFNVDAQLFVCVPAVGSNTFEDIQFASYKH